MIKVSVIIPVYNAADCLRKTLDAVLVQSLKDLEIICVDDGSTDESLVILREYEGRDHRFRVLTQANAGAGAARNRGMEAARGEYLSFLDADDFFEPQMLEKAYANASSLHTDVTVFRSDSIRMETGREISLAYSIREDLLPDHQPFAGKEIQKDFYKAFVGWAWDKLFRTDFLRENGLRFQEIRTTNDMYLVFSALAMAERISAMNDLLIHHTVHEGSLSATREKSWDCFYKALLAVRAQLKDWELYPERERDFINYALHYSFWSLNTLHGSAYYELYERMKAGGWLEELGVLNHAEDAEYFYYPDEYKELQLLLSRSAEEFLFLRRDRGWTELEEVYTELGKACAERDRLAAENRDLTANLNNIYQSVSFRIGRAITWLPRKIRNLVR